VLAPNAIKNAVGAGLYSTFGLSLQIHINI
jgi:hypothetical protein